MVGSTPTRFRHHFSQCLCGFQRDPTSRRFVGVDVRTPVLAASPVQEKGSSVILQDAENRPLPHKNGLNINGIEENTQYMEQEEGKDSRPESATSALPPKGIYEDCKTARRKNKGLCQSLVPAKVFSNPRCPNHNRKDDDEDYDTDENSSALCRAFPSPRAFFTLAA
jgi:hypothetical protein